MLMTCARSVNCRQRKQQIINAFADCGTELLKPIFDALHETIPYDQLHLRRLIYQVSVKDAISKSPQIEFMAIT